MSVTREEIERAIQQFERGASKGSLEKNYYYNLHKDYLTLLSERDSLKSQLATLREENEALKENIGLKKQWMEMAQDQLLDCAINHEHEDES